MWCIWRKSGAIWRNLGKSGEHLGSLVYDMDGVASGSRFDCLVMEPGNPVMFGSPEPNYWVRQMKY